MSTQTKATPEITRAAERYLEQYGDPLVMNTYLKVTNEIAKRKPLRAVFRDSSYGNDSVKINVDQIFRLLSPETEVRSL